MNQTKLPEIGCYGDATHGHRHTRFECAHVLAVTADALGRGAQAEDIVLALHCEPSEDCEEEHEACSFLESYLPHPDAHWGWRDGDFGLWPREE